jgi:hypothetical protein
MPTANRLVRRVAVISAVLGAISAVALAAFFGLASGFSSAVGTVLGVLNLWALARLVAGMLNDTNADGRRARAAILLGAKSLALVTVVGVLVVKGWVHGGALMAGLTVVALSIVLAGALPSGGAGDGDDGRNDDDSSSRRSDR